MNTEIMKEVLAKLNEKLKRKRRKILLLIDNVNAVVKSVNVSMAIEWWKQT